MGEERKGSAKEGSDRIGVNKGTKEGKKKN